MLPNLSRLKLACASIDAPKGHEDAPAKKKPRRVVPTRTGETTKTLLGTGDKEVPASGSSIERKSPLDSGSVHNRFDLQRRFSELDTDKILEKAKTLINTQDFRFVHFGAEDGYLLLRAQETWRDLNVKYIGVEGGTKVSAPGSFIENAKMLKNIYGMQEETLFEEILSSEHPIMNLSTDLKTVALLYDGGILLKQPIDAVINVMQGFVPGSVVIFVTEKGSLGHSKQAGSDYIKQNMEENNWDLVLRFDVYETESTPEATMQALFFSKEVINPSQVLELSRLGTNFVQDGMLSKTSWSIKQTTYQGTPVIVKKTKALTGTKKMSLEVKAMQAARGHANVVELYGYAIVEGDQLASFKEYDMEAQRNAQQDFIIVMEHLTPSYGGEGQLNLYSTDFRNTKNLSIPLIFSHICKHIGAAMHHLYQNGWTHCDIKLANTAFKRVGEDIVFKLIDFGSAKRNINKNSWDVNKKSFREMIMSILTWEILPNTTTCKRMVLNQYEWEVFDTNTKSVVPTELPVSCLEPDKIIEHVRNASLVELSEFALKERTYEIGDSKVYKRGQDESQLMTMKINNVDTYFLDLNTPK